MSILPIYVGLDYHEDSLWVGIVDGTGRELVNRDRPNDVEMVAEFIWDHGIPDSVALEACGGSASFAHALAKAYPWRVRLAHLGYVHRLKQGPDKSDHGDARVLADLLRVGCLPDVWLAPMEILQLRCVVRYRQGLAVDRKNLKLRIRVLLREERVAKPDFNPWTKGWKQWLATGSCPGHGSLTFQENDHEEDLEKIMRTRVGEDELVCHLGLTLGASY